MTDLEYANWLADRSAIRTVLAEVTVQSGGLEVTKYFSTTAYNTGPADTPANQHYSPVLSEDITLSESLSIDTYVAAMSIGDLTLDNTNGGLDSYRSEIWANRSIRLYYGGPGWARADFRLFFDGSNDNITAKSRDRLGVKMRDKLLRLNAAVSEVKMGGTSTTQDDLRPIVGGEVHNMTPKQEPGTSLTYRVHDGAIEDIPEVRDDGLPLTGGFTENLAAGTFTLSQAPAGAITCDVQGDKFGGTYRNTVAALVQRLVTGYGKAIDRFTSSDLDLAQLAQFDADHPQPVGFALNERTNVLNICRDLAASVGAQLSMSRVGKLRLLKVGLPGISVMDVYQHQMVEREMTPISRTEVVAAVKLGFDRNLTPQPGLTTALSAADKELFASEWTTAVAEDAATATDYRRSTEPVQQDTMLLKRTDADAEALRLLNLRKVPREVFQFTGYAELTALELGQTITVHYPRWGLDAGVPGVIVSLALAPAKSRVTVGVLI